MIGISFVVSFVFCLTNSILLPLTFLYFRLAISTIFIPLTFIVGVYGMNFSAADSPWSMPELRWFYGYPLLWLIMLGIAVGMLIYFRRRGWL